MKKERIKIKGQIIESLPSLVFKVELETGEKALTYLGGRMRRFQIKLLPGDDVLVELSPYDRKRGRIVYRY